MAMRYVTAAIWALCNGWDGPHGHHGVRDQQDVVVG